MSKYSRYKVGDCVVYIGSDGYWKVFKIIEIGDGQYKYRCLDVSYERNSGYRGDVVNGVNYFSSSSLVGTDGVVVDESEYMSYIMAKIL